MDHLLFKYSIWILFVCLTGKPFDAQPLLNSAVSNIICCLVFGERFEYSDEEYKQILQDLNEAVKLQGSFAALVRLHLKEIYTNLIKPNKYKIVTCPFFKA